MKFSIDKVKEVSRMLPHGSRTLIADELQLSRAYVYAVFNGRCNNEKVILAGIKLIKEAKEAKTKADKDLEALLA